MARFRPLTSTSKLPDTGAVETDVLDFKGSIEPEKDGTIDYVELAKDVAAFANAEGGTLLVGAFEDRRRGILGCYKPLTPEFVKQVRDAYSRAVAKFCSPSPLHDSQTIPFETGAVVAVNVSAAIGQVVGVRARVDEAWFFPRRVGIETVNLRAEQLPMFMVPEIRRIAILLRGVPENHRLFLSQMTRTNSQGERAYFRSVDEAANVVILADENNEAWTIPLDRIESVWEDPKGWHLAYRTW
jgi:hypothetical protein